MTYDPLAPWQCPHCESGFYTFYWYADHLATHDVELRLAGPYNSQEAE